MDSGIALEEIIRAETTHLLERRSEWSILTGTCDLELTAHALRVLLQLDRVAAETAEFQALADVQRPDGGWNSGSTTPQAAPGCRPSRRSPAPAPCAS